ncbi:hypothetical protein D9758_011784 [Tetrapyrgos nigripes]|uniref:TauD/TfdA-like domain-containing protein n=1 Tax=Tetrapyrgos nigripes TaxID=182062 RepID=A0A8H5CXU6_9AGAR|nr:hypothetical protein D9758_011784 [Tetrapyrgos nigripes]
MSATMTVTTVAATLEKPLVYDINLPYVLSKEEQARLAKSTPYPQYLPTWDPVWFDPLPAFEFHDPALRADPAKPNLIKSGVSVSEITPKMGTILQGVDLSTLTDSGKDELALLVSQRKIVVLPTQDTFIELGPGPQQEFMKYFGKQNYQPVSGSLKGYPGFHIIHRDGNKNELNQFFSQKTTSCLWHQDVSYERQPPGYVMLGLLQGPEVGGDTVFASTDEAYKRLSPMFQSLLDKIKAVHSSANMIAHTRSLGGLVRKDPVQSIHPLIRVHPVTAERCIFVNGEFITGFQGMKQPEFEAIRSFLLNHITAGHDFQARVRWQPKTVVIFDNRSTLHTAVVDYFDEENGAKPRHIFRLASMAEVPIPVNEN